jgi:hypothetical protein
LEKPGADEEKPCCCEVNSRNFAEGHLGVQQSSNLYSSQEEELEQLGMRLCYKSSLLQRELVLFKGQDARMVDEDHSTTTFKGHLCRYMLGAVIMLSEVPDELPEPHQVCTQLLSPSCGTQPLGSVLSGTTWLRCPTPTQGHALSWDSLIQ